VPLDDVPKLHYKVVHDFASSGAEGEGPMAGILLASDGNGYGTTEVGGAHGGGVIFRIDGAKQVKPLHSFDFAAGWMPNAPLTQADDGALYGVVPAGGRKARGAAFRHWPDGGFETLHDFGPGNGATPDGRLLFASDGQFYGTALGDGSRAGRVYRMDKAGEVAPLWAFDIADGPALPAGGVTEGPDGRLYGATTYGGIDDQGTVYSLAKDGSDHRVLHRFTLAEGIWPAGPLTLGRDGKFYGTTWAEGPQGEGTVFCLAPDGELTLLHGFGWGPNGLQSRTPLLEIQPGIFVGTTTRTRRGAGVAYVVTGDGRFAVLHRFGGTIHGRADGAFPAGPLQLGERGQVIGTCRFGGAGHAGTIWTLTQGSD
jgi:uncharacterized repeat protein (TIGR03803 family)